MHNLNNGCGGAEADQWRRARTEPRPRRASLLDRGRRLGALAAAGMARRLDECAAKEAFQRLAPDGRPEVGA